MLRHALIIAASLLLPILVYLLHARIEARRQASDGVHPLPWHVTAPWLRLAAVGIVLAASAMVILNLSDGTPAGGNYIPAHLGPDGELVPGRTVPPDR